LGARLHVFPAAIRLRVAGHFPLAISVLGLLTAGMRRHGYDLSLTSDASGWRATFLHRSHFMQPWVGQVLSWWPTPWRAVQEAAWRALNTPFAQDYSLSEESLR